jgi:hypothetical protein
MFAGLLPTSELSNVSSSTEASPQLTDTFFINYVFMHPAQAGSLARRRFDANPTLATFRAIVEDVRKAYDVANNLDDSFNTEFTLKFLRPVYPHLVDLNLAPKDLADIYMLSGNEFFGKKDNLVPTEPEKLYEFIKRLAEGYNLQDKPAEKSVIYRMTEKLVKQDASPEIYHRLLTDLKLKLHHSSWQAAAIVSVLSHRHAMTSEKRTEILDLSRLSLSKSVELQLGLEISDYFTEAAEAGGSKGVFEGTSSLEEVKTILRLPMTATAARIAFIGGFMDAKFKSATEFLDYAKTKWPTKHNLVHGNGGTKEFEMGRKEIVKNYYAIFKSLHPTKEQRSEFFNLVGEQKSCSGLLTKKGGE